MRPTSIFSGPADGMRDRLEHHDACHMGSQTVTRLRRVLLAGGLDSFYKRLTAMDLMMSAELTSMHAYGCVMHVVSLSDQMPFQAGTDSQVKDRHMVLFIHYINRAPRRINIDALAQSRSLSPLSLSWPTPDAMEIPV